MSDNALRPNVPSSLAQTLAAPSTGGEWNESLNIPAGGAPLQAVDKPYIPKSSAGQQSDFSDAVATLNTPQTLAQLHALSGRPDGFTADALVQLARASDTSPDVADAAYRVIAPENKARLNALAGGRRADDGVLLIQDNDFTKAISGNDNGAPDIGKHTVSKQGTIGDCWVLAALGSVLSQEGGQQMIADSVKIKNTGTYQVRFKGEPETTYVITPDQVAQAQANAKGHISTDDGTVAAIESALQQRWQKKGVDIGAGGGLDDLVEVQSLLTGRTAHATTSQQALALIDSLPRRKVAIEFGAGVNADAQAVDFSDPSSRGGHAFFVNRVDAEKVYYSNPWDTSVEHTMPRAAFSALTPMVSVVALDQ